MRASRAVSIDFVSGFIRIGEAASKGPQGHPLVRSLGPAFETAFGIEPACLFPGEIRALAEALLAGPLGDVREARPDERRLEPA